MIRHWLAVIAFTFCVLTPFAHACTDSACVGITSGTASVNSEDSALLNTALNGLLGTSVSLSAAQWNTLAGAGVDIGLLDLNASLSVADNYSALADAARVSGDNALADVLDMLSSSTAAVPGVLSLAELIQTDGDSAATLNALDLTTALASLASFTGASGPYDIAVNPSDLGLGNLLDIASIRLLVLEPPQFYCGSDGGSFRGATIRAHVNADLALANVDVDTGGLLGAVISLGLTELDLYVEVGGAEGTLTAVDDGAGLVAVSVSTQPISLYLGQIDNATFFSNTPLPYPDYNSVLSYANIGNASVTLPVLGTTVVGVEARAAARDTQDPLTATLSAPFPASVSTGSSAAFIGSLASSLLSNLELRLQPVELVDPLLRPLILDATASLVGTTLSPVLSSLVDPLLSSLGAGLGETTVTAYGTSRSCTISGCIYQDTQPNSRKDVSEDWANGSTVTLQLRDASNAIVDTLLVTAGSGEWSFTSVVPGDYQIVVARNETDNAEPPEGWLWIQPEDGMQSVTVAENSLNDVNFGLYHGGRVSGTVVQDNGTGGGTAYDAIINGEEIGIAGLQVSALNADTVIARTITDVDGTFELYVPYPAVVDAIRSETRVGDISVSEAGGATTVTNDDQIDLTASPGDNISGLIFGDVTLPALMQDQQSQAVAGSTVWFAHRLQGSAPGSLLLGTQDTAGWVNRLYTDTDCDGQADGGASSGLNLILSDNGVTCFVLASTVPAGASDGASSRVTLLGNFAFGQTGLSKPLTLTDLITVSSSQVSLYKSVDKQTARPGDTLTYTLTATNMGAEPVKDLKISDYLPAYTDYVLSSAFCSIISNEITACEISEPEGNLRSLGWTLKGSVLSGQSVEVKYTVKVQN